MKTREGESFGGRRLNLGIRVGPSEVISTARDRTRAREAMKVVPKDVLKHPQHVLRQKIRLLSDPVISETREPQGRSETSVLVPLLVPRSLFDAIEETGGMMNDLPSGIRKHGVCNRCTIGPASFLHECDLFERFAVPRFITAIENVDSRLLSRTVTVVETMQEEEKTPEEF